jgi:hypothetical protein
VRRLVPIPLVLCLLAAGCGESGREYGEERAPTPSTQEVEQTLNAFETAFREKKDFAACRYLTPRSLREFVAGTGGTDPGKITAEGFAKACPLYLRILSKGVKVPRVDVEIESVVKEKYKGRYYLIAYPPKGPSVLLDNDATHLVIMAGPEAGE